MEIFADTGNLEELKELTKMGVVDGCTTNPIIIAKAGNKNIEEQMKKIVELIKGPVSLEVTTNNTQEMIEQAKKFAQYGDNVVVKIPMNNAGLEATSELSKLGIKTNVTACMNLRQVILAAKAGATYASLFWARIEDMGYDAAQIVSDTVEVLRMHEMKTKIIIGSFRQLSHINQAMLTGAHVLTIPTELLKKMSWNPRTETTIQEFLHEWEKFNK